MAFLRHLTTLAPALLVGGCSLIYNPSNISKPPVDATDAQDVDTPMMADAAIDAPPLADANPAALMLEKIGPAVIYEGQGTGGSRQALVVLRGHHMTSMATVMVTPTTDLTVGAPIISMNGDFMLVPLTVAINGAKTSTDTTALTVQVDQPGATSQMLSGQLTLQYLPELDSGTTIASGSLAPMYSRVMLNNVSFTGTEPVKIRAVSSITIGNVDVSGADANDDTLGAAGVGGCPGGAVGQNGGCSTFVGGGAGAAGGNGGGGGGFGGTGTAGAGGAAGGAAHGGKEILNYVAGAMDSNRSGGGGGGSAIGLGTGGAGGGGGGTIELTAGGNIMTGTLTSNGGDGGDGTGGITGITDASGGGGGGSGGVIVVRSVAGTIATGAINATGGAGGAPRLGGGGGGAGAEGRIRIDSPAANPPSTTPTAYRGPTFASTTPTYVTTVNPMLTIFGQNDAKLDGYVIDMDNLLRLGEPVDQTVASGSVMVTPTLIAGFNKLCFTLEPANRPSGPTTDALADSCIDLVYLP